MPVPHTRLRSALQHLARQPCRARCHRSRRQPQILRDIIGLHVEDADDKRSICAAARSISITRWCCAKPRPPPATGLVSTSPATAISTRPPRSFPPNGINYAFAERPFQGRTLQFTDPVRLPDRTLRDDGKAPASAAALRSLQRLPSAAAGSFQRLRRRSAGHHRFLRPARLPADRIWRGRRPERPHRRRLDASQGQCPRLRHHQRQGPAPAPFRLLGADRDEHPASLRRDGVAAAI